MARNNSNEVTGWLGWAYFSGFLMIVMGILQMITGFTALLNDRYYLVSEENLVVFDFTTWGWVHLLLGLVVMMAGTAVFSGKVWGRVVGVMLAVLGVIFHFTFVSAYPIWSIIAIVVNVLIIYALTVHGDEAAL